MLKVTNLNKYFNRHQRNQIHVLNDINLSFPEKGLVTILGTSGSGKTTFLNAICGLDKVDSGMIEVDRYQLKKYKSDLWDKLRSEYYGYIFQNYNLFMDKTVFDNVSLSLRLLGIKDETLIRERTLYTLGTVGMDKYKNRLAGSLSGGEQQRVAIARALVKDARIIIADEPTGNLDEKNTIEIMNIIKKISQSRLVVLVTHEREMAYFYSDRIIEIKDGVIEGDSEMTGNRELALSDEKNIYLADLPKTSLNGDTDRTISSYNDEAGSRYDVKLVIQGKNLYILASSPDLKVRYLDEGSEIRLIEAHRPVITKDTLVLKDFAFEPLALPEKHRFTNIKFGLYFKMGIRKIFSLARFKKLMLLGFALSAFMMAFAVTSVSKVLFVNEADILTRDRHLIKVHDYSSDAPDVKKDRALAMLDREEVTDIMAERYGGVTMTLETYFLGPNFGVMTTNLDGSVIGVDDYDDLKIIAGQKPANKFEVVVDKMLFEAAIKNEAFVQTGTNTMYSFLHQQILATESVWEKPGEPGPSSPRLLAFTIVGICDNKEKSIYADRFYARSLRIGNSSVRSVDDVDTNITDLKKNEVLVNEKNQALKHIGDKEYIADELFTIRGYFASNDDLAVLAITDEAFRDVEISVAQNISQYNLYSTDPEETIKKIAVENLTLKSTYEEDLENYKRNTGQANTVLVIITAIIISASLIYLYFLIRSSLISRITEIGIYRALGFTKGDIYLMFIAEILAITTLTSLPGYVVAMAMINKINSVSIFSIFSLNLFTFFIGLALIYLLNLLSGLTPIFALLRRTPREIISKYDI